MCRVIQKSVDLILSGPFLALLVFLLYIRTLAPGVWGFDSAELATGVYTLGIVHPPGYPLYIILGKFFSFVIPVSDLAYRLNLMSAIFAAITIWILYLVIKAEKIVQKWLI